MEITEKDTPATSEPSPNEQDIVDEKNNQQQNSSDDSAEAIAPTSHGKEIWIKIFLATDNP